MSSGQHISDSKERALVLLGQGIDPETVASAVGRDRSWISQLISDPEFSAQIAELRFAALSKHNVRDGKYDEFEDTLLEMLKDCLPFMMHKPWMILKAITTINSANRRGASAPSTLSKPSDVVQLVMPTIIMQKFVTNINQQVIKAGEQELVTVQSSSMESLLKQHIPPRQQHETLELERSP